jgi:anti-sigma regulatory factor (Ser/Thr protein kinase)
MSRARFPNDPTSVPAARRFVADAVAGVPPEIQHRVVLMVSEIATNAIKHARTGFTVSVEPGDGSLRVEVRDSGGGRPVRGEPPPTQPDGRGLLIVERLADAWGVERDASGTVVWFSLAVPAASPRPG